MNKFGSYFYRPKRRSESAAAPEVKRWDVWAILKKAVAKTCMVIGAMVLLSAFITFLMLRSVGTQAPTPLAKEMVLTFDLTNGIAETQTNPTLFDPFPFTQATVRNVVAAIDRAKDDTRVKAIIFRLNGAGFAMSHVQELQDAILRFQSSGKKTYIYAPSYLDPSGGLNQYNLASTFDEIWMQPVGMFSISGPSLQMPFAKNALAKIGISADFLTREEYKSAMENFTNVEISEANKEALDDLLADLTQQMTNAITLNREEQIKDLQAQIDKGLLTDTEALEAGLVDKVAYYDDMKQAIKDDVSSSSVKEISYRKYNAEAFRSGGFAAQGKKTVALIYIVGAIMESSDVAEGVDAQEIAAYIHDAVDDDNIDGIILRVDSPGGSPSASETIRRAVWHAVMHKPTYVSMGPVAASGGYWLASGASKIIASPATLTGSIGVVMGKFEASGLSDKLGVNWQGPQVGENADIWSVHQPFDKAERKRMNTLIDATYNAFLERVAEGRNMPLQQAQTVAKGRPWTGVQARELGLVDVLGGLDVAAEEMAKELGLESRQALALVRYPKEGNRFEQLIELFGSQISFRKPSIIEKQITENIEPFLHQAEIFSQSPIAVYDPILEALR